MAYWITANIVLIIHPPRLTEEIPVLLGALVLIVNGAIYLFCL